MRNPSSGGQWGILGGTFNPVHRGHLAIARDMIRARSLDGILMVPSFVPPRKVTPAIAPFEDRVAMLRLACEGFAELLVSTIEAESDEPGYTLLTVRALKKRYPTALFSFIIGADLLVEFPTWYEAEDVLEEVTILVGSRPNSNVAIPAGLDASRFTVVNSSLLDIASSDIRLRVHAGVDLSELSKLVPDQVASYILERGLYR